MPDAPYSLGDLVSLIERQGVHTRFVHLGGRGGGLCAIGERQMFFIDEDADQSTQLEAAIRALAALDVARAMFLPPAIREAVDRWASER